MVLYDNFIRKTSFLYSPPENRISMAEIVKKGDFNLSRMELLINFLGKTMVC